MSRDITVYVLSSVSKCKYLGTILTEDNVVGKEIQERIKAGNKCYGALLNIMKAIKNYH